MVGFGSVAVMLMAVLGGAWGWHVGTRRLYRRSYFDMGNEPDMVRRNRERRVERVVLAALYAASVAAAAAILVVLMLKR
jgi:hypothetical protein